MELRGNLHSTCGDLCGALGLIVSARVAGPTHSIQCTTATSLSIGPRTGATSSTGGNMINYTNLMPSWIRCFTGGATSTRRSGWARFTSGRAPVLRAGLGVLLAGRHAQLPVQHVLQAGHDILTESQGAVVPDAQTGLGVPTIPVGLGVLLASQHSQPPVRHVVPAGSRANMRYRRLPTIRKVFHQFAHVLQSGHCALPAGQNVQLVQQPAVALLGQHGSLHGYAQGCTSCRCMWYLFILS